LLVEDLGITKDRPTPNSSKEIVNTGR